jgi:hypothetical protein
VKLIRGDVRFSRHRLADTGQNDLKKSLTTSFCNTVCVHEVNEFLLKRNMPPHAVMITMYGTAYFKVKKQVAI